MSSCFTTTHSYSIRIIAATTLIRLSISRYPLPSLVNKTPRFFNSFTWGSNLSLCWSGHSTLLQLWSFASDVELLILISAANHSSGPPPDEANRTTLFVKGRDETKSYEQSQWPTVALAESKTHRKEVQLAALAMVVYEPNSVLWPPCCLGWVSPHWDV